MLKISRIIAGILMIGLLGAIFYGTGHAQALPAELNLDLAVYPLKDPKLREALGIQGIPIRAKNYTLPPMSLPLLKLDSISEDHLYAQLAGVFHQTSAGKFPPNQVRDLSDLLTLKRGSKIYWISKASGAYSFSETTGIMSVPTTIPTHREAVDLALKLVVERSLIALGPNETLDVEFVSNVMNAAVKDGEQQPFTQYASDYFVGLGRRYRGIPVVGSRLILRLGDDGKLFGVQKTWRPIVGEGEWVTINASEVGPPNQNSIALNTKSGYIEGPVKNEQLMMAPGIIVSYIASAGDEMSSQKILPLASVNFPLTGVRKGFAPATVKKRDLLPRKDRDDQGEDELN